MTRRNLFWAIAAYVCGRKTARYISVKQVSAKKSTKEIDHKLASMAYPSQKLVALNLYRSGYIDHRTLFDILDVREFGT